MKDWFRKLAVTAVVGGSLIAAGSLPAQAADCHERVRKAEQRLNNEQRKHGDHSRQAEDARRNLDRERRGCDNNNNHHNDHHDDNHQ